MDGYEAARRIKSNPDMKAVPIIAMTAYALAAMKPKHSLRAVMPTSPSHTAHARYSQRCVDIVEARDGCATDHIQTQQSGST
jgi:CheY-like chemotaxis protein